MAHGLICARVAAFALLLLTGCATTQAVRAPGTQLDRVVVYRNGVAYFERYAEPTSEELTLVVPAHRVDDLLKSLTIVEQQSGRALPVRYPTIEGGDGDVTMTIPLAKHRGPLRITYVTESPAWKPSYRVILNGDDEARLHAWAIVDNVSGEDWRQVRIGVGSTSALSFRYDLHSVQLVDRQQVGGGQALALAPPTGGSPYAVAGKPVRLLANLDDLDVASVETTPPNLEAPSPDLSPQQRLETASDHVAEIERVIARVRRSADEAVHHRDVIRVMCSRDKLTALAGVLETATRGVQQLQRAAAGERGHHQLTLLSVARSRAATLEAEARQCVGQEADFVGDSSVTVEVDAPLPAEESDDWLALPGPMRPPRRAPEGGSSDDEQGGDHANSRRDPNLARRIVEQLKGNATRIRVEGFARPGEADAAAASRQRARDFANQLARHGIATARIEVLGTGLVSRKHAVRVVDLGEATETGLGPDDSLADRSQPLGEAHFVSEEPLTIENRQSAMVSILNAPAKVARVYLFDPLSPRGSKRFTFNALRLVNPSRHTLAAGPVTVYADGQFLGEGLTETILGEGISFIPYALDRTVIVDSQLATREEIAHLVTIQRGVATAEVSRIRRTELQLNNRGKDSARVFVRHAVADGYELATSHDGLEKLGRAHLIPVEVPAGTAIELLIEERAPVVKSVDLRSDEGVRAIGLHLRAGRVEGELAAGLTEIVESHAKASDIRQQIESLDDRMGVYRTRIEELNEQLVTLKKVPQAGELRRHLAAKMKEVSQHLQRGTMRIADLKTSLLAAQVALQSGLAELTLERQAARASSETPTPPSG